MIELNQDFWNSKYENQETGWDIGHVSTPLKEYIDQLTTKDLKILIPGAGNAYEAEYLHKQGYSEVHVVDIAPLAIQSLSERLPTFPKDHLHLQNFFEHTGQYDLIIEQTFFCALDPALRADYVQHMHRILKPGGKLAGLLFGVPMREDHPPYGGCRADYLTLFEPYFDIKTMEDSYNSIEPRQGSELFFIAQKKIS